MPCKAPVRPTAIDIATEARLETEHNRARNGHFKLQITGHPEFGLPYGQDRLIPIFLATLAVRQQSQTVRFKSGATILEMFGVAKGGTEYRRIVAAFERIFGTTIFFGTEELTAASKVVHRARFNFMREASIWYEGGAAEENTVVLSDEFFGEVMAHPIPADMDAIALLAASPGAIDLFLWLSYRSFTPKIRNRSLCSVRSALRRSLAVSSTPDRGDSCQA